MLHKVICSENSEAELGPVSLVAKDVAISATGLEFDSRTGQIEHNVANATVFLRCCVGQALNRGDGPATCYALRHNSASAMKFDL